MDLYVSSSKNTRLAEWHKLMRWNYNADADFYFMQYGNELLKLRLEAN